MPMPAEQNRMPTAIAESAATDSTERSMWPAMITSDRPMESTPRTLDASMMLAKMPSWKKFGTKIEKTIKTKSSMNQDEVVEHELDPRRARGVIPTSLPVEGPPDGSGGWIGGR